MTHATFVLVLLLLQVSLSSAAADTLGEFSAYYSATTNGIRGTAERHLVKLKENNYRINVSLEANLGGLEIGDLEQASEFSFTNGRIKPLTYSYQVSGVSSAVETVVFDWDAMLALSANEKQSWSVALNNNTLDELSYQLALALDIAVPGETIYSYETVDGDALDKSSFRVLGEEIISTPLGDFRCVKLERDREASSSRTTTIWLALDWSNLLARIEQTSAFGLDITLELTNALIAGQKVSPLTD